MGSKRSQVSLESLMAFGMVLFIFTITSFLAYQIKADKDSAELSAEMENECFRISALISKLSVMGPGSEVLTETVYNATFEPQKSIIVEAGEGKANCLSHFPFTIGKPVSLTIEPGPILLQNRAGIVRVEEP